MRILLSTSQTNTGSRQQIMRPKAKQKRHKHSEDDWNRMRNVIKYLYIEENKRAEEVVHILDSEHNFQIGLVDLPAFIGNSA
jgi:hypothetical protein